MDLLVDGSQAFLASLQFAILPPVEVYFTVQLGDLLLLTLVAQT